MSNLGSLDGIGKILSQLFLELVLDQFHISHMLSNITIEIHDLLG
jgi:hypothetical protein